MWRHVVMQYVGSLPVSNVFFLGGSLSRVIAQVDQLVVDQVEI